MTTIPHLTEKTIKALVDGKSFARGYNYYNHDAVSDVIQRGTIITAEVEGSHDEPYNIQITWGVAGIEETHCTCPYDWGDTCKHIVATLLVVLHDTQQIEVKPELHTLLDKLSDSQLRQIVLKVGAAMPDFIDAVEQETASLPRSILKIAKGATSKPVIKVVTSTPAAVDTALIRREIIKDFRAVGVDDSPRYDYYYDEYSELNIDAEEMVQPHLEKITMLLDAGDCDTAVSLITTVIDAYIDGVTDLDEWVYEYNEDTISEASLKLCAALAEVILSQELSPTRKADWLDQIDGWASSLTHMNMVITAIQQGWTHPLLVTTMNGEITDKGVWEEDPPPHFADDLAIVRLRILARQGQTQAYIYLAHAEAQTDLALNMMARVGQIKEAVAEAKTSLPYPAEILALSQILIENGETEAALEVAEHGLTLTQKKGKLELARWLCEQAQMARKPELALKSIQTAFLTHHELSDYIATRKLAGEQWLTIKPALLAGLQQNGGAIKKIDVYLHEGMFSEATKTLDHESYVLTSDLERVIAATRHVDPDWGIRQCQRRAEAIMDSGKANKYSTAITWLSTAKGICDEHQMQPKWQLYLTQTLQKHARKYKLVPMLKTLR